MLSKKDQETVTQISKYVRQYVEYLEYCNSVEGAIEVRYYWEQYCEFVTKLMRGDQDGTIKTE